MNLNSIIGRRREDADVDAPVGLNPASTIRVPPPRPRDDMGPPLPGLPPVVLPPAPKFAATPQPPPIALPDVNSLPSTQEALAANYPDNAPNLDGSPALINGISISAPTSRNRYAGAPPTDMQKDADYIHQLQTAPVVNDARNPDGSYVSPGDTHTPSRGRAFLMMALRNLGGSMQHAQAQASAEGRQADWGDLALGAAGAAGAGVAAAANPVILQEQRRAEELQRAQGQFHQDAANAQTTANIDYIRARPGIAYEGLQTKRDIADGNNLTRTYGIDARADVGHERNDILTQRNSDVAIFNDWRMKNGDKRTDAYLDFTKWRESNGDHTAYTREQFNQWQMDHGDEMADIAGQNAVSNTTRAGAAVTNSQANLTRANRPLAAPGSRSTGGRAGANVQGQASTAINQLQSTRAQLARALSSGDKRMTAALQDKLKGMGDNIRARFGNVVGDDENGWPTRLKAQGQAGGQGSSQRVATQQDVAEYARRTGVDVGRAAEHFRASGYAIQ
ncbi:MAG: hypothetical protein ACR2LC_16685 [Pyrinomonadaceae bacterium]